MLPLRGLSVKILGMKNLFLFVALLLAGLLRASDIPLSTVTAFGSSGGVSVLALCSGETVFAETGSISVRGTSLHFDGPSVTLTNGPNILETSYVDALNRTHVVKTDCNGLSPDQCATIHLKFVVAMQKLFPPKGA